MHRNTCLHIYDQKGNLAENVEIRSITGVFFIELHLDKFCCITNAVKSFRISRISKAWKPCMWAISKILFVVYHSWKNDFNWIILWISHDTSFASRGCLHLYKRFIFSKYIHKFRFIFSTSIITLIWSMCLSTGFSNIGGNTINQDGTPLMIPALEQPDDQNQSGYSRSIVGSIDGGSTEGSYSRT